jgi:hypothetical protein
MSSWKAFGMDINKDLVGESSPNTTTHPTPAASINRQPQNPATNHGYHTAMDFFRRQLLHE